MAALAVELPVDRDVAVVVGLADGQVRAPMPGKVTALTVKTGQTVARGAPLLTLEAMKMEHALTAPVDGKVEAVSVKLGDQVSEGSLLVKLAPG